MRTTGPTSRRASQPSFRLPAIGRESYATSGTLWMLVMRLHFLSTPVSVPEVGGVLAADGFHRGQSTREQRDLRVVVGRLQCREFGSGAFDFADEPLARLILGEQILVGPIVDVPSLHQATRGKL